MIGPDETPPLPAGTTCARLTPDAVREARARDGARCGRPAVDMLGPDVLGQQARCAVHRGIDQRTETNRRTRATRERILRRHRSIGRLP